MADMQRPRRLSSFLGECSSCTSSFASRCKSQASLVYCSDCESLDGYIIDVELPLSSPPNISTPVSRQQDQQPDPRGRNSITNTTQERYTTNMYVPAGQLRNKDVDHVVIDMSGMNIPERTSAPPSIRPGLPTPAAVRPSCIPAVHNNVPTAVKSPLNTAFDSPRTSVPEISAGHSIPSLTAAQLAQNLKSQLPSVPSTCTTATPVRSAGLAPTPINSKAPVACFTQNNKPIGPKLASLPPVTSPRASAAPAVSPISLLDNSPAAKAALPRCNTPNRGRANARSQLLPSLEAQRCDAGTMLVSQRAADVLGLNPTPQSQQATLSAAMRCNTPNRVERAMYVQFSFRNREQGPRASQSGERRV